MGGLQRAVQAMLMPKAGVNRNGTALLFEHLVRKPGERGWRLLGWRMTDADASAWAEKNSYEIERVAGPAALTESIQTTGTVPMHVER